MRNASSIGCLLILLFFSGSPSEGKTSDKNVEIVKTVFKSLAEAINGHKSGKIAELFTSTGEFVDGEGNVFEGREAIAREFEALFQVNPRSLVELTSEDIREISPGVLMIDGMASLSAATAGAEPEKIEFAGLLVKQTDGRWLLASIRSEGESDDGSPTSELKRLAWLVGEWVDESDESTIHTQTRWSDDKKFLLTDFSIYVAGRKVMNGTQRIGWDGALGKFKSWVFDSEGGHAEGIWTEHDDHWVVSATGIRSDGEACSATHTYEPDGADAYLFSATNRIEGDTSRPDVTVRVVRKPPEPQKTPSAKATPAK